MNHIIPVATSYQSQLLRNVERMSGVFQKDKADKLNARNIKLIEEIAERTATIETKVEELVEARKIANKIEDEHAKPSPITTRLRRCSMRFAIRLTSSN